MSELPFDLKAYRVIPYDTHFAHIKAARQKLVDTATGALHGTVAFGNPVLDFLPHDRGKALSMRPDVPAHLVPEPDTPGLLDQMIALEDGFVKQTTLVEEINDETRRISDFTVRVTNQLTQLSASGRPQSREARALIIGLGQKLDAFASFLGEHNDQYTVLLAEMGDALESVMAAQEPRSDSERDALAKSPKRLGGNTRRD